MEDKRPIMTYPCVSCGGVLVRRDDDFKQFLVDIFNHTFECNQDDTLTDKEQGN